MNERRIQISTAIGLAIIILGVAIPLLLLGPDSLRSTLLLFAF